MLNCLNSSISENDYSVLMKWGNPYSNMTRVFVKNGDVGITMMSEKTYKVGTKFPLTTGLSETGRVVLDG